MSVGAMTTGATWVSPDAAAVLAALADLGIVPPDGDAGPSLAVAAGPIERLALGSAGQGPSPVGRMPGLVAVGIATVDAGRMVTDLAGSAGSDPALVASAPSPDAWLGARAWSLVAVLPVPIVLLEPATEGRLAGALARGGEGPLVAWVRGPTDRRSSVPPGVVQPTVLGPGVVVRSGGRWGPFLVALVASAGRGERGATIPP